MRSGRNNLDLKVLDFDAMVYLMDQLAGVERDSYEEMDT